MSVTLGMARFQTFADDNQFQFICPIFNAKTSISACFTLREGVWMGKRIEKRRGCQACMRANKCPIDHITKRVGSKDYGDPYGARTVTLGTLRKDDLERILNVKVDERTLEAYGASQSEKDLVATANERIRKAIGSSRSAPTESLDDIETEMPKARRKTPAAAPVAKTDANREAALRGDISAAINAAA